MTSSKRYCPILTTFLPNSGARKFKVICAILLCLHARFLRDENDNNRLRLDELAVFYAPRCTVDRYVHEKFSMPIWQRGLWVDCLVDPWSYFKLPIVVSAV